MHPKSLFDERVGNLIKKELANEILHEENKEEFID